MLNSTTNIPLFMQELTDAQAAQLCGAVINSGGTDTGVIPTLPPRLAALIRPFYTPLPIPKLARLKLPFRAAKNTLKDTSVPVEE
jgi:hypothetical protein